MKVDDKLIKDLKEFIDKQTKDLKDRREEWKSSYEWAIDEIESEIKNAKLNVIDLKKDGFTVLEIEEQGYMRGLANALIILRQHNPEN